MGKSYSVASHMTEIKVCKYTYKGDNSDLEVFVFSNWVLLFKERIWSQRRANSAQNLLSKESKFCSIRVVSIEKEIYPVGKPMLFH